MKVGDRVRIVYTPPFWRYLEDTMGTVTEVMSEDFTYPITVDPDEIREEHRKIAAYSTNNDMKFGVPFNEDELEVIE